MPNIILSYLALSTALIIIQIYGLKINFQGLKYVSPLLVITSAISFFYGYYFLMANFKRNYLLVLPLLVAAEYYFVSKLNYQEKIKTTNLKVVNNWTLKDAEGHFFNMNKVANKIIFINFWDSKCAYCFKKLPYIERIKRRVDSTQVVFLEINPARLDSFDTFKKTVLANSLLKQSNSYFEENKKLSHQLSVSALPNQFIIDKKGRVRYSYLGFASDDYLFFEDHSIYLINSLIYEE